MIFGVLIKSLKRASVLVALLGASAVPSARADFLFNPTGDGTSSTFSVTGLGFGPGNALAQASIPLTVGSSYQVYFQTHLTSLTGPNAPNAVPGLNSTFQITEVATFREVVTSITTTPGTGTTATFALAPGSSQISIYENNAVTFSDAKGTGFTDGTLIASLKPSLFISSQFTDATQGGGLPTTKFNQVGAGNGLNATADQGSGSSDILSSVTSYNKAFFQPPSGNPLLVSSIANFNVSSVFDAIAPSLLFTNPTTSATFAPNIGSNNGTSGPDFQFQVSGFTQSFIPVPEPASFAMTLIGFGGAGLGSFLARRKRKVSSAA